MTRRNDPIQMALPPPTPADVTADGRVVGWLAADGIGFGGFAHEDEAMAAAWMAYRTLARGVARRDGTRLAPVDVEPLTVARHGARETIVAGTREIATLVRPLDGAPSGRDSFGFELRVPGTHDAASLRATAFLLYRTLRRSGIRWAMWLPDARDDAPRPVAEAASDAMPAARPAPRPLALRRTNPGLGAAVAGGVLLLAAWALLGPTALVAALGATAAVLALVLTGALVHLVAVDVRGDVRRAVARWTTRRPDDDARPPARAPFAAPLGGRLAAYHDARRGL